jgi:hypothetical protein
MPRRGLLGNRQLPASGIMGFSEIQRLFRLLALRIIGQTLIVVSHGIGSKSLMQSMFWYNPTTRTEEERQVPESDDLALNLLDGDQDSAQYIALYKEYRTRNGILEALIETGGYYREIHAGRTPLYMDWPS